MIASCKGTDSAMRMMKEACTCDTEQHRVECQ